MGAIKKAQRDDTFFDELTKVIEDEMETEPVDLQSKVINFQSKRNSKRELISGMAVIFDVRERILARAELKNLSLDGASFEIAPAKLHKSDQVFLNFTNGPNIGLVLCTVQWIVNIEGHRHHHKLIGLKFHKLTTLKKRKLIDYITKLKRARDRDPFYVG